MALKKLSKFITLLTSYCLLAILAIPNVNAKPLPDLGSDARSIISPKNEVIIGKALFAQLRASEKVSFDLLINSYLNHLGKKIAVHSHIKYYPIKLFGVADDSFNAFAFFGGHIGVHEGLIVATANESELAAVIAHEIAHIEQEHLLRQIAKQRQLLPITMAETIAAIAIGNPDLILPILAGYGQQVINFTRDNEKEADRVGIQMLTKAGFDPQSMPNLFQNMSKNARYESRPPEYLLTHPIYENRIADARHRADSLKYQQANSSLDYYLIKARINALARKNINEIIFQFEYQLNNKRFDNAEACQYGYALALTINHQPTKALSILEKLAEQHPNNVIIHLGLAETEIAANQTKQANTRIEKLLKLFPDDLALITFYTEQLLKQKKFKLAKNLLHTLREKYPEEPSVYYNLSRIESSLGNTFAMHQANAEWYFLHADYDSALVQLELALQVTKNKTQINTIKKRQQEITNLLELFKKI